jgi:hypothetical protein
MQPHDPLVVLELLDEDHRGVDRRARGFRVAEQARGQLGGATGDEAEGDALEKSPSRTSAAPAWIATRTRTGLAPRRIAKRTLGDKGDSDGRDRLGKDGEHAIARRLDDVTAVRLDRGPQEPVVDRQRRTHRRAVLFPEAGAAPRCR